MTYKEIVWLASYPKSGNTWLRLLFDAYFLQEVDINAIVSSVSDDNAFRHAVGNGVAPKVLPVEVQALTRPMALLRLVNEYKDNRVPNVPLLVKTHSVHGLVNGIELLPECLTQAVICLVRDPRDVLVSFTKHMGLSTDEGIAAFTDTYRVLESEEFPKMADFISSWAKNVASYVNADTHNVRIYRYEDLKAHPVDTFSHMLEHAGVPVDRDRVKDAVALTALPRLQAQEQQVGFRESSPYAPDQFFGQGQPGGWQEKLTSLQQRKIQKSCQTMMKRLGYLTKKGRAA